MTSVPILCSTDIVAWLGARPVDIVTGGESHPGCIAFLRHRAADDIAAAGEIPILAREGRALFAWPVMAGARESGVGR